MGIISLINADKLYWLGRYTERVYTTLRLFAQSFDKLIDTDQLAYNSFCAAVEIPAIYTSGEDFVERYLFDPDDPNSVLSNLTRAFDNAVTLREEIGSECVSYIQLAIYAINKAHGSQSLLVDLQHVIDHILSFWGLADDLIPDENVRNIIKTGKRVERLDLYARLHQSREELQRELYRLTDRITRTSLSYNVEHLSLLKILVNLNDIPYNDIVEQVEGLI